MTFKKTLAALAALAGLSANAAQAQTPCVTTPEATSIALVAMPEVIRQVGQICAARVPAGSLLRQTDGTFIARYQAEAERAWPAARTALGRVAGPDIAPLLQSDFTRPMLVSLLAPALVDAVKPQDCSEIDRIVTLAQPLPPQNAAGLIVATLKLTRDKQAEFGNATLDIPICRDDRR
ncbi:hypothetical protein [Hephaestia mangrovi]|uniref:hypothetical protein n=1 Tax=Hephaestia mangrovi TaxID=2873268 RepID=UPI001CA72C5A|nr:hypothetical protein [Hephaestia mangrovi]MBY8827885.1 hypothetical protein [Hephaestia mangrovi]